MNVEQLIAYATQQIGSLHLGPSGPLGSEYVVAYDDAGDGAIRLSDGRGLDAKCRTTEEIDSELAAMADWISEE